MNSLRLDDVLRELDLAAQRALVHSLPAQDALRLRATCKQAQAVVDAALTTADLRLRCPAPTTAADGSVGPAAWWEAAYCPRVSSALKAVAARPCCGELRVRVVTPGAIGDSTTGLFARPFLDAHASGLSLPHVTTLSLHVLEPQMLDSAMPFSGPALVLTLSLAAALSALFPSLKCLALEGPCWAAPDSADVHLPRPHSFGNEIDSIVGAMVVSRTAAQKHEAQAAFAALSPQHLPRLRRLSAPIRVVRCSQLHLLSGLTSLHVDCEVAEVDGYEGLFDLRDITAEVLHAWCRALPNLQRLSLSQADVGSLAGFVRDPVRPPGLQSLALRGCCHYSLAASEAMWESTTIYNLDMAFHWTERRLDVGHFFLELPHVGDLVRVYTRSLGFQSATIGQLDLRSAANCMFSARALQVLQAAVSGHRFPSASDNREYQEGVARLQSAAAAAPVDIRLGAISCSSARGALGVLMHLLGSVGPCAALLLVGAAHASLSALQLLQSAQHVPRERLPRRLAFRLDGSDAAEWASQVLDFLEGLRRELQSWPPLERLTISCAGNVTAAGHAAGEDCAERLGGDWIAGLLLFAMQLDGHPHQPPVAAAVIGAAGGGSESGPAPAPAFRTAPGFWCAIRVPVRVAAPASARGKAGRLGFTAWRCSLVGVLDALPPHVYLHAECPGLRSVGGAAAAAVAQEPRCVELWLAVTLGPGPEPLRLERVDAREAVERWRWEAGRWLGCSRTGGVTFCTVVSVHGSGAVA